MYGILVNSVLLRDAADVRAATEQARQLDVHVIVVQAKTSPKFETKALAGVGAGPAGIQSPARRGAVPPDDRPRLGSRRGRAGHREAPAGLQPDHGRRGIRRRTPWRDGAQPPIRRRAPTARAVSSPADDAVTAKACTDIKKDIKDNAAKVAKAEKIGPPAGNFAVSAQWSAGSAAVIAHSIGANEAVSAAADAVQKEMNSLGDAYGKSANAKPSTAKLEAAVKNLNTACSATT